MDFEQEELEYFKQENLKIFRKGLLDCDPRKDLILSRILPWKEKPDIEKEISEKINHLLLKVHKIIKECIRFQKEKKEPSSTLNKKKQIRAHNIIQINPELNNQKTLLDELKCVEEQLKEKRPEFGPSFFKYLPVKYDSELDEIKRLKKSLNE